MLNLADELGNVSRACRVIGFSRDTIYRYKSAVALEDIDALIDANPIEGNPALRTVLKKP